MVQKPSIALGVSSSISLGEYQASRLLALSRMLGIDEIRRSNLLAEAKRLGGDAALARALGKDKNQVYQWIKATGKKRRNMGNATARKAELALNRPKGWLDKERSSELAPNPPAAPFEIADSLRPKNNVKALRIAMQSLFVVLHANMRDIAEAVAEDIVETAGTEFAAQGFLNTAVGILRGVRQTSAGVVPAAPQAPGAARSKRERAG